MAAETRAANFDKHRRQFTDFVEFDVRTRHTLSRPCSRFRRPGSEACSKLTPQEGRGTYMESIREMMQAGGRRLMLNLNDVRHFSAEMASGLLNGPAGFFSPSQQASMLRRHRAADRAPTGV